MIRPARLHALAALLVLAALAASAPAVAAPPANDARTAAVRVTLPSQIAGSTVDATLEADEPFASCGSLRSSVFYEVTTATADRLAIRLDAGGDLDGLIDVFQRRRSQLTPVRCDLTDRDGDAAITFKPAKGATYLIRVGARSGSAPGPFALDVFLPQPAERPPGRSLPAPGVTRTVDPIQNTADVFSLRMQAGRSYRINLSPGSVPSGDDEERVEGCVGLRVYSPGTADFDDARPLRTLRCGGYLLWTPRAGEGGRYVLRVVPGRERGEQRYHLQAAGAGDDDTAPGLYLSNRERARGVLSGRGIDVVDLYRFDVNRRSDLEVALTGSDGFAAVLLSDRGRALATLEGTSALRRTITPGRYFVAVRAEGRAAGRYALTRTSRTITRSRVSWGGTGSRRVAPGTTSRMILAVSPAVDGPALLTVQRFDPLAGWLFHHAARTRVRDGRAVVAFRPPAEGRWRVRGEYRGTVTSASSDTGYAYLLVAPELRP